MNFNQTQQAGLIDILRLAILEIRNLTRVGNAQQSHDLSQAIHQIPEAILDKDGFYNWESLLEFLQAYEGKYPNRFPLNNYSEKLVTIQTGEVLLIG